MATPTTDNLQAAIKNVGPHLNEVTFYTFNPAYTANEMHQKLDDALSAVKNDVEYIYWKAPILFGVQNPLGIPQTYDEIKNQLNEIANNLVTLKNNIHFTAEHYFFTQGDYYTNSIPMKDWMQSALTNQWEIWNYTPLSNNLVTLNDVKETFTSCTDKLKNIYNQNLAKVKNIYNQMFKTDSQSTNN